MPSLTPTPDAGAWQSAVLTADEVWQVTRGVVALATDAADAVADSTLGIILLKGQGIDLPAGTTVYYRARRASTAVFRVALG